MLWLRLQLVTPSEGGANQTGRVSFDGFTEWRAVLAQTLAAIASAVVWVQNAYPFCVNICSVGASLSTNQQNAEE